ncbi:MAG: hypothetical protein AB8G23_14780 [Myxococcota bacterium]
MKSQGRPETWVESVRLDVAHDSDGLVVLGLRFPNGAESQLPLDGPAIGEILRQLSLDSAQELVGRAFSEIAPALPTNLSSPAG